MVEVEEESKADELKYANCLFERVEDEPKRLAKMAVSKNRNNDTLGVKKLEQQIKEMTAMLERKNMAIRDTKLAKEEREREELDALKKKLTSPNKNIRNPNMKSGYILQSPKYVKENRNIKELKKKKAYKKSTDDSDWRAPKKKKVLARNRNKIVKRKVSKEFEEISKSVQSDDDDDEKTETEDNDSVHENSDDDINSTVSALRILDSHIYILTTIMYDF
jgi:hypothetical protein